MKTLYTYACSTLRGTAASMFVFQDGHEGSPGVLSGGLWGVSGGALAGAKVVENIRKYQATHLNEWFDFSLLLKGSRVSLWGSLGR